MTELDQMLLQFSTGAALVHKVESLKCDPRTQWITPYTSLLTKVICAVYSLLIAFGISFTFAQDGDYGQFTIAHIPLGAKVIWDAGLHAFAQYWGIKGYYHAAFKKGDPPIDPADQETAHG